MKTDSTLACWGHNSYGQASPPAGTFSQVSAGGNHTCGLRTDGIVACWGYNSDGQASPPAGTFSQVSAGGFHTCGVRTNGIIACWGAGTANTPCLPHCGQADPDIDGDGCTDAQELGLDEELGGRRDPNNPYDLYDIDDNDVVDLFYDILTVAYAYGADADDVGPGEPDGYATSLDRSAPAPGADVWDMGPPDGTIDLFTDIFGVAYQFGHACA